MTLGGFIGEKIGSLYLGNLICVKIIRKSLGTHIRINLHRAYLSIRPWLDSEADDEDEYDADEFDDDQDDFDWKVLKC